MNEKSGLILHLQRLSTEDGPGIRTTVFFKGCPLRCLWCHNPESLSSRPQVQWLESRCIGCGTCVSACPNGCLTSIEQGVVVARELCAACGACTQECPTNALELLGTVTGVEELVTEVCKDRTYFKTSGGGVTASGGEPLLQPEFVAAFLRRLQEDGVSTALDTCGLASRKSLAKVLPHVNVVLFDLKEIDPGKHFSFTGQRNEVILGNLLFVRDYVRDTAPETRLWLRTPLIPDATATPANLRGLGAFIAQNLDGFVERWELCAFNNLCRDKYQRLGLAWPYGETPLLSAQTLQALEEHAKASGVTPDIVVATGATRVED